MLSSSASSEVPIAGPVGTAVGHLGTAVGHLGTGEMAIRISCDKSTWWYVDYASLGAGMLNMRY